MSEKERLSDRFRRTAQGCRRLSRNCVAAAASAEWAARAAAFEEAALAYDREHPNPDQSVAVMDQLAVCDSEHPIYKKGSTGTLQFRGRRYTIKVEPFGG